MKFGKKHVVLGALVVALGAAVFLNWQFSSNSDLLSATTTQNNAKELGKAQYANANTTSSDADTDVMVMDATSRDYFETVRETRDETQQQVVNIATEILKSTESDDTARTQAVASAAEIATLIQQQANIESLIKAKGFSECMAYIQNGECNIVVNKGVLTEALAVVIKDIVNSQSAIDFDKISITEV